MNSQISSHIDQILDQRKPSISKIIKAQDSLSNLHGLLLAMKENKDRSLKNEDEHKQEWEKLDFDTSIKAVEKDIQELERLKERFSRQTLRIGVAGQSRQGKSKLLQSLTGLSNDEIPTGSGGFLTGARSLIIHQLSGETYAMLTFFSKSEFLEEIIHPYYKELNISPVPQTIDEFRKFNFGDISITTGGLEAVALPNQLRDYQNNLSKYENLLGTERQTISREGIIKFIAQYNPEKPDEKYHFYRAVREVHIYTTFPQKDIGRIALADLPGLDEIKAGEADRLIKALAQDVDMLLFVKLPPETGDAWKGPDMQLYQIAQKALYPIPLENCSFMILNRHEDGKRDERCEAMSKDARQHGIYTSDIVIANCADQVESRDKILIPVLSFMTTHIQQIDEDYFKAKKIDIDNTSREIEYLLESIQSILNCSGAKTTVERTFTDLFNIFQKKCK